MSLALAVLFTFLLTPLAGALERIHFPRFLAIFLVVGIAIAAFGGVGWTVGNQVLNVTNQLPSYKSNISAKIDSIRNPRSRRLDNAADAVKEIGKEITDASSDTAENASANAGKQVRHAAIPKPAPAQIYQPASNPLESLNSVVTPLGSATSWWC